MGNGHCGLAPAHAGHKGRTGSVDSYAQRKRDARAAAKAHGHKMERESEIDLRFGLQLRCKVCGATFTVFASPWCDGPPITGRAASEDCTG